MWASRRCGEAQFGEETNLSSFKEFWQVASNALGDWAKTMRMCVLITVISMNWAVVHWLMQH
jgi:hypothetical protein